MSRIELNLLPPKPDLGPEHRKKGPGGKIIIGIIIIAIIILAVFSSSLIFSKDGFVGQLSKFNLFQQFGRLVSSTSRDLKGESEDRVNVLIMGMGGKNHEGGTLADTIILASYKPSTKEVALISVPRDLSVPTDNYGWMKINAVNAYAEKKEAGSGGPAMLAVLNKLLDTDISYYVTVDFDGFEKVIDEFGGVDVEVDNDLIDYKYPIRGKENVYPIENRFEVLKIKKGPQHLDGESALKYARSRHALGVEGSDFARARRQQKIIMALKDKILSASTLFSPKRVSSLMTAYSEHITANLQIWELLRLAQFAKDIDTTKIINKTLTDGPDGLLHSQMVNGAYILLPDDGNFEAVKSLWKNIFGTATDEPVIQKSPLPDLPQPDEKTPATTTAATSTPAETTKPAENTTPAEAEPAQTYQAEGAKIEIQNGTNVAGWAGQEKIKLTAKEFLVIKTGNAAERTHLETIIYDLSKGQFPATISELEKIYGVSATAKTPSSLASDSDIVVILGK